MRTLIVVEPLWTGVARLAIRRNKSFRTVAAPVLAALSLELATLAVAASVLTALSLKLPTWTFAARGLAGLSLEMAGLTGVTGRCAREGSIGTSGTFLTLALTGGVRLPPSWTIRTYTVLRKMTGFTRGARNSRNDLSGGTVCTSRITSL